MASIEEEQGQLFTEFWVEINNVCKKYSGKLLTLGIACALIRLGVQCVCVSKGGVQNSKDTLENMVKAGILDYLKVIEETEDDTNI